jgi:Uma2 family endonuclease
MAAHPALTTKAQYLASERSADERHEFVHGHVYAMAGASRNHLGITAALSSELRNSLRGGRCRNLDQDTKVWIERAEAYFYPDASVSCPPNFVDAPNGIIDNPTAIFEVSSTGTESLDEGPKFAAYRELDSLRDYVVIDSRTRSLRVYSLEGGTWLVRRYTEEQTVPIPSLGIELNLDEIYRFAEFSSPC